MSEPRSRGIMYCCDLSTHQRRTISFAICFLKDKVLGASSDVEFDLKKLTNEKIKTRIWNVKGNISLFCIFCVVKKNLKVFDLSVYRFRHQDFPIDSYLRLLLKQNVGGDRPVSVKASGFLKCNRAIICDILVIFNILITWNNYYPRILFVVNNWPNFLLWWCWITRSSE